MGVEILTVHKDSEFFIAIVKQGRHSSLMPGVVIDGQPRFLTRIGKDVEIDPNIGDDWSSGLKFLTRAVVSYVDATLEDEGIYRSETYDWEVSYQAYSITLEQYQEFLSLTADIENSQKEHYKNRNVDQIAAVSMQKGIGCYTPSKPDNNGQVTLTYTTLDHLISKEVKADKKPIIDGALQLHVTNTCRTTARAMLEYTLGGLTNIPSIFAVGLEHKTSIKGRLQSPESFYILPPPPPLKSADINPAQLKVLKELYKKLEDLPKTEPNSTVTRKKFDELKNLYKDLAPTSKMDIQTLLDKITVHRAANSTLFDTLRGQSIIGKFAAAIGFNKTGTQKAYDVMEKALNQEIKRQNKPATFNFSAFKARFNQLVHPVNNSPYAQLLAS